MLVKFFTVMFTVIIILIGLLVVRGCFDGRDEYRAIKTLYAYKPNQKSHSTVKQLMLKNLGIKSDKLICGSRVILRYEGKVILNCYNVSDVKNNFLWQVQILNKDVKALNNKAVNLLLSLDNTPE